MLQVEAEVAEAGHFWNKIRDAVFLTEKWLSFGAHLQMVIAASPSFGVDGGFF